MRSKIIWKWVLTGALSGIFLFHPLVMITDYFMREPLWAHGQSVLDIILHETFLAFTQKMVPWNLSFAIIGALVGLFYGRTKQAKKELRETEEEYRTFFESSRDAIMALAPPAWLFTSGNPATVELFRVKDEAEFISLGSWQLSPERQPDDRLSEEKAKEMIETAMHNGSHFFEWTHCHYDGTPFPAEVLLTRMEQRDQVILQATVRDITERKRKDEVLRESEKIYKVLFEESTLGIVITDIGTGMFIDANSSFCRMCGYLKVELLQLGIESIHPNDSLEHLMTDIKSQERGEQPISRSIPCLRKDGTVFYADIVGANTIINGRMCIVGFFMDITKRKQAEEQRGMLILDLQKALSEVKTLRGFLPICSHCKKIRDDKGYWNQIESYIRDRSDAEFSHSICPECAKKLYSDMDLYEDNK